jgi:hypothetical protein
MKRYLQDLQLSRYLGGLWSGRPVFDSRQGQDILLYFAASRQALSSTQPPVQWVSGASTLDVKVPVLEADRSKPSSAEVKNGGAIPPRPHMSSWYRCLIH